MPKLPLFASFLQLKMLCAFFGSVLNFCILDTAKNNLPYQFKHDNLFTQGMEPTLLAAGNSRRVGANLLVHGNIRVQPASVFHRISLFSWKLSIQCTFIEVNIHATKFTTLTIVNWVVLWLWVLPYCYHNQPSPSLHHTPQQKHRGIRF